MYHYMSNINKLLVVCALRGLAKSILCLAVVLDLVCSGSEDKAVSIWRGVQKEYLCLVDTHLQDVILYFF